MSLFTALCICCVCLLLLRCESTTGIFFNAVPGLQKQCIYYQQDLSSQTIVIGPLAYKEVADRELVEGTIYYNVWGESPPGSCPSGVSHAGSFPVVTYNVNIFSATTNGSLLFWSAARFDSDGNNQIDPLASNDYRIIFSNYAVGYAQCKAEVRNAVSGTTFAQVPAMKNGAHQYLTMTDTTICQLPEALTIIWTCDGTQVSSSRRITRSEVCTGAVTEYMMIGIKPGFNGHLHADFPLETFVIHGSLDCSTACPTLAPAQVIDMTETLFACYDQNKDDLLKLSEGLAFSQKTNPNKTYTEELVIQESEQLGWDITAGVTRNELKEFYKGVGDVSADYKLTFGSAYGNGSTRCPLDAATTPVSVSKRKAAPTVICLAMPLLLLGIPLGFYGSSLPTANPQ